MNKCRLSVCEEGGCEWHDYSKELKDGLRQMQEEWFCNLVAKAILRKSPLPKEVKETPRTFTNPEDY